jgi:PAS domain S-box-containing protein
MSAAAALGFVLSLVLLGSRLPYLERRLISDVGLLAAGVLAAASCGLRSRDWTGRRQRAWLLFAAAMAAAALGNTWVLAVDLVIGPDQGPERYANVFFLFTLLFGLAGFSAFPSVPRRGTDFARMLADGVIIGGSIMAVASATVFTELVTSTAGQPYRQLSLLVPAMLDVAVLTLTVLLFVRTSRADRVALALVGGGLALYAVSDLTRSVRIARDTWAYGTPVDAGWIAGYLLVALAGRYPYQPSREESTVSRESSPALGTVLVFALVFTAAMFGMYGASATEFNASTAGLWLVLVLAVAIRQILLIVDNDRLRHSLERRVDERTQELRQATRHSELLLSSVGEGIYGVDRLGSVTFVNPAGALALGYQPDDLIGREAHATFHHARDDGKPYPRDACYVTEAIRDGTVTHAEEDLYIRSNGRSFPVEVTATPMASDDYTGGAVVVFRDVTQRQEVDRLKSEFVSMVSHELRTPLTSIRGSLGLLAGGALGPLPASALRMIDLALDSSARLTRLINDILDIERIESGHVPMEVADHRVETLIDSAAAQLQVLAAAVDVQVVVKRTDGVVRADADRVVQTLINLLDNAIKFSPPGTVVEVSSRLLPGQVEFVITDQGRGIPPDKIEQIFSRFEQVDSSDAREKGGSGLGLAISRSVIERLGGRIWAESAAGGGATFRFTLPRGADLAADSESVSSTDAQRSNNTDTGARQSLPPSTDQAPSRTEGPRQPQPAEVAR